MIMANWSCPAMVSKSPSVLSSPSTRWCKKSRSCPRWLLDAWTARRELAKQHAHVVSNISVLGGWTTLEAGQARNRIEVLVKCHSHVLQTFRRFHLKSWSRLEWRWRTGRSRCIASMGLNAVEDVATAGANCGSPWA